MNCHPATIPSVTATQMRTIDDLATGPYGIALLQMMELAGHELACLPRSRFLHGDPRGKRVHVLAGRGGNGGGGLVAARRLANACADVTVWLASNRTELTPTTLHQLQALDALDVPIMVVRPSAEFASADLLLDALIGYSLRGEPRGATAALIQTANHAEAPVLSLDLPSGLDATTGFIHEPCIRAEATLSLALPKTGLWRGGARDVTGEIYLADIGFPPRVYEPLGFQPGPIFARDSVVRIG
jgi:NAD(P)H-hydrate epimerase